VSDQPSTGSTTDVPLAQQWEIEQQNWQRLLLAYADSTARDENFLIHLGNAMRGSLLAGKPYPGTVPEARPRPDATMANDEVVFALRRLDGQVNELIATVDGLARIVAGLARDEDRT
jgi:hypothetical protein